MFLAFIERSSYSVCVMLLPTPCQLGIFLVPCIYPCVCLSLSLSSPVSLDCFQITCFPPTRVSITMLRLSAAATLTGVTSYTGAPLQLTRRALWTSGLLSKKKSPSSRPRAIQHPASSAYWTGLPPSSATERAKDEPHSAPKDTVDTGGAGMRVPSPVDFGTYEEYLHHYNEELELFKQRAVNDHDKVAKKLEQAKKEVSQTYREGHWGYLRTFIPMFIMMCVYFGDVNNRTSAQMTQRAVEEHARSHCSVKWERL